MAKLIGVCREDNFPFAPRQLPLLIDETLTLAIHFTDRCLSCDNNRITQRDVDKFKAKFKLLNRIEQIEALTVPSEDLIKTINKIVPCIGCRKSVERLFNQLVESGHPAIEPLLVTPEFEITVYEDYIERPKALTTLFQLYGQKINEVIDSISKTKKHRRCGVHSLDSQRTKPPSWLEVWELMSAECQSEVVIVELDVLQDTLETFLKKHKFCGECKSMVMKAYNILVKEVEAPDDEGFMPKLYEGLRCCASDNHVHVDGDIDFIASLIERAQPELQGNRRERHAKTLEIAQEEVLTCIGVCLYDRLVSVWQKLREEEQTWQLLFYLGIHSIRQRFELTVEQKQGFSQLELICEEISRADQAKQLRKEHKRQKKRKRRNKEVEKTTETNVDQDPSECEEVHTEEEGCEDWEEEGFGCPVECQCASSRCDSGFCEHDHKPQDCPSSTLEHSCSQCTCLSSSSNSLKVNGFYSDCGYSSGASHESTWSTSSSCESSEVASTDGFCNHEGDVCLCSVPEDIKVSSCTDCSKGTATINSSVTSKTRNDTSKKRGDGSKSRSDGPKTRKDQLKTRNGTNTRSGKLNPVLKPYNLGPSLQDMLMESTKPEIDRDEPYVIPAEMTRLQAQLPQLNRKRLELREKLRQQFAQLRSSNKHLNIRPRTPQPE